MVPHQSPLVALHQALASAAYKDLPDTQVYHRASLSKLSPAERDACMLRQAEVGITSWPGTWVKSRPTLGEIVVSAMFVQYWPSTALGFGGVAGQAVTAAYTVVLSGPCGAGAVYIGGRFAYLVPPPADQTADARRWQENFRADIASGMLTGVVGAVTRYGARP